MAMKEPVVSRHRRSNQSSKLNLVCSFNGTFQPRPPSGELRYTGGQTRIVSVERNAGFSRFKSKISELICPSNGLSFSLKYQLPDSGPIGGDAPLVLITSDDDVRWMIDEYDKLESSGKPSRLWIFVCNDNGVVNGHTVKNDVSLNYLGTDNLNNGFGVSISYKGLGGDTQGTFVKTVTDSLCGDGVESRNSMTHLYGGESGGHKVENSAFVAGNGKFDSWLRKVVLKQQLLGKPLARSQCFRTVSGFPVVQNNMEFTVHGSQSCSQPFINLVSEPQGHLSHEATNPDFGGDSYGVNMLDNKSTNTHLPGNQTFGNFIPLQVARSHPLDGNPHVEVNGSVQYLLRQSGGMLSNGAGTGSGSSTEPAAREAQLSKQSCSSNPTVMPANCDSSCDLRNIKRVPLSNLNRENIMPCAANCESAQGHYESLSCSNQLAGSVYPVKSTHSDGKLSVDGSIHNHRFGTVDARNQRTCSYYVRNHRTNLSEMGNCRNVRVDGRRGKFYPGLKSNSSISKQGQVMRSYGPTLWKPWSGYHGHTLQGVGRIVNSGLINQTYSVVQPHGSKENIKDKDHVGVPGYETPTPTGCDLCYHDDCASMGDQSLPSLPSMKDPSKCASAMKTQEDLLCGFSIDKHEVPCQTACKNFQEVPMNVQSVCYDMKDEMCLKDLLEDVSISGFSNNLGSKNGTVMWCDGKLPDVEAVLKSFGNHQKSSHTTEDGTAYSVDLSLCNLSLSSSKEGEPPAHSSHPSNDASEALLMTQSKILDLMDEELLNSYPQVEKSNGFTSNSSCQMTAKLENDKEQRQEIWQDSQSSLITVEKADIERSHKFSKVKGGIPRDLAEFYTHLVTRELQTIKHSDLEYIKELGSGTYGAVFYGKWKGSDVAIKRIKPTCLTVDALEDNRVVADFLKEAHMLAQLHHPNIVAFYGVAKDGPITDFATVTEYMVNGSLKQVLRKRDRTIDRRKRLIIAMDAAFGMEYLHEKNIVHFDLKSHNFLVNMRDPQRPVCKIGDLGLSKIKQRTLVSGGVRGTIPWMAPELLNSENNMVSEKVDVYSFGIVMWELLTGEEPYFNMRPEDIIAGTLKGDVRPEIPSWCDPAWKSLMERCWSSDPDSRPSFAEIARELRAMSAAMNIK